MCYIYIYEKEPRLLYERLPSACIFERLIQKYLTLNNKLSKKSVPPLFGEQCDVFWANVNFSDVCRPSAYVSIFCSSGDTLR